MFYKILMENIINTAILFREKHITSAYVRYKVQEQTIILSRWNAIWIFVQ